MLCQLLGQHWSATRAHSASRKGSVPTLIAMFYIIGLGLSDEKDVTVRGLEVGHSLSLYFLVLRKPQVIKRSSRVYLESYTSILMVRKEKLV